MFVVLSRFLKAGAVLLALTAGAAADEYPNRPIRLIIPFPPGGSNDVVGRLVARHLSDVLGQQVFVDNRGGAGGTIGTDIAAKAAPDGYTLLVVSLAHAVNPWLYKLPYDHAKAFVPIASFGSGTNVLAVNPELPVNSVQELIALAKQNPGQLQLRLGRDRQFPASRWRVVQADGRRRYRPRAVPRRWTGHDRRHRRPHQDRVQFADSDDATRQGRQA